MTAAITLPPLLRFSAGWLRPGLLLWEADPGVPAAWPSRLAFSKPFLLMEGRDILPHPARAAVGGGEMLHPAAEQWEAAGNGSTEPNANRDHAGAAAKWRSSLCPAVAYGNEGVRKGHLALCHSHCSRARQPVQPLASARWGFIRVSPSTLGWCQPAQAQQRPGQGAGGYGCPKGRVGVTMAVTGAVHPKLSFTSWFITRGLPPSA